MLQGTTMTYNLLLCKLGAGKELQHRTLSSYRSMRATWYVINVGAIERTTVKVATNSFVQVKPLELHRRIT